jgi:hypothetical protein
MKDAAKRKPTKTAEASLKDIGSSAGKVWHYLNAKGPASADAIKRGTKLPNDVLFAALGWLAREGKVLIEVEGKKLQVALK